ncbi:MAG: hypothetical protein OJF49_004049 [Ktedonobacterales bacterium]|jgi:outer membrane protein assembly factor BamB|nr:MAG: hypothetical protein OJF49_004049 [Ktedonobacterales bacterium]
MTQPNATADHSPPPPTLLVGSRYGTVWLLHADTGSVLWRQTMGGRLGTLVHGGDTVYVPAYIPMPTAKHEEGPAPLAGWLHRGAVGAYPSRLTALRARDGATLWICEGWSAGRSHLALDDNILLTDALDPAIGERTLSAIDSQTGDTHWSISTGPPWGLRERFITARAGRVYLRESTDPHVLDTRTGATLWSYEEREPQQHYLSESGALLLTHDVPAASDELLWAVRHVADGTLVATLPPRSKPLALTDSAVYLSTQTRKPRLVALRFGDGAELWRVTVGESDDIWGQCIATDAALYFVRTMQRPRALAEVLAFDPTTGQQLWRWHSPAHLLSLLRLWGRHTPEVLLFAFNEARRSAARAREERNRHIFYREVLRGQWRRPGALIGNILATAGWGKVFICTNMGVFALRASDGHLLWHALPTMDLSWITPALPPESV